MKKCSNPDHPHCTYWVAPGENACAGGHAQAAQIDSFELINALRQNRPEPSAPVSPAASATSNASNASNTATSIEAVARPNATYASLKPANIPLAPARGGPVAAGNVHLHISGFDPRAAGGRQTLKMELRGMATDGPSQISMQLRSDLIPNGATRQEFVRTTRGDWRPVFVEFSSRNKEHGQYQIDVDVHSQLDGRIVRKWVCTFVILVPRRDATLTEIHQIFLSTHKNVRVMADDASIARVSAPGGGNYDIDVTARNAGIAHVDLAPQQGKIDMGFTTIAWDEELIEIDLPGAQRSHPHASRAACLVNAAPEAGAQRQIRLFALDECILGRFELVDPDADVLLSHFSADGQDNHGLTRRLSGRHAVIRRGQHGFEIEDVSRYGVLLDGVWPGKYKPTPLRLNMRIELSASIKGIVVLSVTAIMPHGVILHRIDDGARAECFYLLAPDKHPGYPLPAFSAAPHAAALPLLFHHDGGFWHLDQLTGKETALGPATALDKLSRIPRHNRFASEPYPECWIIRTSASSHPGVPQAAPVMLTA